MQSSNYTLFTDGGSRNNPGIAGAGWVVKDSVGNDVVTGCKYLGIATNNEAEYQGLILGLKEAGKLDVDELQCFLDSNLIVNQLNGIYRIKQPHLQKLAIEVKKLEKQFNSVTYKHICREKNKQADALANKAMNLNAVNCVS